MLLDALAAHFIANSIGTSANIFKSFLPNSPDFAICIYEYAGRPSDKAFGTTIVMENARFQVVVRSDPMNVVANAHTTARNKAEAIKDLLDGAGKQTLSGIVYHYIEAMSSSPSSIEIDDNQRQIIRWNYEAQKDRG